MRSTWMHKLLVGAVVMGVFGSSVLAQSGPDEGKRKLKSKVSPVYPELARRMNVSGKVKIELVIAPDGHVKSSRAIGGHPLLVQACLDAVKGWKFVPGPEESTQLVEFDFTGSN